MTAAAEKKSLAKEALKILPVCYFLLQVLIGVWLAFWLVYNHQPKTGDDVEHLHSAWLVWQGKVPYQDFFQHHNPLLWYTFAPLMGAFAYNIAVFDAVRIISTLVMFVTLFVAGLTVRQFIIKSWYAMLLVIASVFPSYVVFSGSDFRPDNYMICAFILGQYWLFSYLKYQKTSRLVLSFMGFFISFMFMQKIVFTLVLVAAVIVYQLYAGKILLKDFLKALILPLLCAAFFLGWLIWHDMVGRYWLANYIFNLYIPDVYGTMVETTRPEFYVLLAFAFAGSCFFMVRGNTVSRILVLLWLAEAVQRLFYFSLDRHYYYMLQIQSAMLAGAFVYVLIRRYNWSAYLFVALSLWGCLIFKDYCLANQLAPNYHRYVTPKYVLEETNKCDAVLNGYGLTYGIFTKDITYYWNLNGQLDVIGSKIGLAPLPNLEEAVVKYLPRIVYTAPYWNEKLRKQHIDTYVHWLAPEIRHRYYNQSVFKDIFILKPEYQNKRRCRYVAETDSWEYFYKE